MTASARAKTLSRLFSFLYMVAIFTSLTLGMVNHDAYWIAWAIFFVMFHQAGFLALNLKKPTVQNIYVNGFGSTESHDKFDQELRKHFPAQRTSLSAMIPMWWIVLPLCVVLVGVWMYASKLLIDWLVDSWARWYWNRKGWGDYDQQRRQREESS